MAIFGNYRPVSTHIMWHGSIFCWLHTYKQRCQNKFSWGQIHASILLPRHEHLQFTADITRTFTATSQPYQLCGLTFSSDDSHKNILFYVHGVFELSTLGDNFPRVYASRLAARSRHNCLPPLKHWGRGFQPNLRHGCLCVYCVCAVLCAGSGLTSGCSPIQRSPTNCVKKNNEKAAKVQQRVVEPYVDGSASKNLIL
jgi:hypothetical protein